jgi:Raf kinase inhibitor-like YbhB/YbcL family protein
VAFAALGLAAGCGGGGRAAGPAPRAPATITLRSPAFRSGATIPDRFTCASVGKSPPLTWSGVPAGARELALLVDDPSAPGGTYVHWILFHLPPGLRRLPAGSVPDAARQAVNSAGSAGWTPPCPPKGDSPHRYAFVLYALRAPLGAQDGASANEVRAAIARVALRQGRLTGRFGR